MFDSTCKFIATHFSRDLATWLLGKPIHLTELKPSELSLEPIRADSLILLESAELVLHIEFQTDPDPEIPFRLLDYRVRLHRLYPHKQVHQVVIYLRKSNSPLVYQEVFELARTRHEFNVIRLWEVDAEELLQAPGLWPFAVLGQGANREAVLRDVASRIEGLSQRRVQSNLAASTAILAGLILDKGLIQRILREEIMRESVIYQEIKAEGRQEGREEGRQEGREEGREEGLQQGRQQEGVALIWRQLNRRLGQVAPSLEVQIRQLSIEQLEELGEALLDFDNEVDLVNWLESQ
jgi:predicted transposase/invertase (TIGR01784 family)